MIYTALGLVRDIVKENFLWLLQIMKRLFYINRKFPWDITEMICWRRDWTYVSYEVVMDTIPGSCLMKTPVVLSIILSSGFTGRPRCPLWSWDSLAGTNDHFLWFHFFDVNIAPQNGTFQPICDNLHSSAILQIQHMPASMERLIARVSNNPVVAKGQSVYGLCIKHRIVKCVEDVLFDPDISMEWFRRLVRSGDKANRRETVEGRGSQAD